MNAPLLSLRNISYTYEDGPEALRQVTVSIGRADRIAVLGGNGAGKSTFFLVCNGVLHPDCGQILLDGAKIEHRKRQLQQLRRRIGVVFQDPDQQIIASTVEAEISFGPMNLKLPRAEVQKRVEDALVAMKLVELRMRQPHTLSGGEKKRVSIADILAMHPDALFFDEPTASLDPLHVGQFESVLSQLQSQGMALVISTHDVDFAWRWAQRILVFAEGRLLLDDAPERVFADEGALRRAGLRRPTLYEVGVLLKERGITSGNEIPRTVRELSDML